jgi:putative tricarboxylic transport membrane protein
MFRMKRALPILAALCLCFSAGLTSAAENWSPERFVEIVAGSGAGGAQDRTARTMQRIWQERRIVAVPVNVSNKPGGGGTLSLTYLNQQGGEGRHIAVGSPSFMINHIAGKSTISLADVTPLARLFSEYIVLAVRTDSPLRSGADLLQRLKADPASVSAAVATARGGMQHIAVARLAKAAGADFRKMRIVVFNSGGESISQVLGGHIDVVSTAAANAAPHVASGQLRILGIAAPRRMAGALAAVPTWKEQGADVVVSNWRAVIGPRAMSAAQVAWWDQALQALVSTPEWSADVQANHWVNNYLGSSDSKAYYAAQYEDMRDVVRELMAK